MEEAIEKETDMNKVIKERIEQIRKDIVPRGYKESEGGVFPKDWELKSFKDIFVLSQGLQIPISERFKTAGLDRYIYITNEYVNNLFKDNNKQVEYILSPNKSVICNESDILMTRTGNTGIVVTGIKGAFHNNFFKIAFDNKEYDRSFLVYLLNSDYIQYEISRLAGTSTIPDITHSDFYSLKKHFPNIKEQRKIADILSTWDRAIELKESLIKEKEKRKKGLMRQIFSQIDKTIFVGDLIKESKVTEESPTVEKLLTVRLHLEGVSKRELRGNETVGATTLYKRSAGQFIYGKQNFHNGALGIVPVELDGFLSSSDIPSFDFDPKQVNPLYFYYYWSKESNYKRLAAFTTGTGSKRLNPKEFYKIKMKFPPLNEQSKIANLLSTADKEISLLKQELEQLEEQKKGLMQLLLTGIVRVGEVE